MPEPIAINISLRLAAMDDGSLIPITDMFDSDCQPTDHTDEAAVVVIGPDLEGKWHTAPMHDFGGMRL